MRKLSLSAIVFLAAAITSLNVLAVDLGQSQISVQPEINHVPEGTIIPMLDMQFNCEDCEQDAKIKALVEGAYLDQAELEKAKVDETQTIIYMVSKYRSRGKARFFVGMLAGAENITGMVNCDGVDKPISDIAISAINGIESVARNVGKDAYQAVKECVLISSAGEQGQADAMATPVSQDQTQSSMAMD